MARWMTRKSVHQYPNDSTNDLRSCSLGAGRWFETANPIFGWWRCVRRRADEYGGLGFRVSPLVSSSTQFAGRMLGDVRTDV